MSDRQFPTMESFNYSLDVLGTNADLSINEAAQYSAKPDLKDDQHRDTDHLSVRKVVLQAFGDPSSAPTMQVIVTTFITCKWSLTTFMRQQFEPGQLLSSVVTLTGMIANAQATTCSEYISQFWPRGGPVLLKVIDEKLIADKYRVELTNGNLTIKMTSFFSDINTQYMEEVRFHVTGPMGLQVEIAEALCWLTATFRISCSPSIAASTVILEKVGNGSSRTRTKSLEQDFVLTLSPLVPLQGSGLCWTPLFTNIAMAVQFPVPRRNEGVGLEIPPLLMAHLAGIVLVVEFQGGMILKGLSTALVPMKQCDDGKAVQWHLFHTDSRDGFLDLKDPISGEAQIDFLKVKDPAILFEKRAYLGWCKHAKILLGTEESDYASLSWSAPSAERSRTTLSGFSLGLSSNGLGIFGPSATINFAVAKYQRTRFMNIEQQLKDRLRMSLSKPTLVFDTSTRRGWLVPTTSVLIHMIHPRRRELGQCGPAPNDAEPEFANPREGDGLGPYEVLMTHLQPSSQTSWKETLAIFFTALDMALKEVTEPRTPARSESSEIYGYEMLDVVRADSPFRFSQRKIQKESGGWALIAQDVGYVLFCSGLGDAIVPGEGSNRLCGQWAKVPSHCDYLSAYVPCVCEILERQGWHGGLQTLRNCLYEDCDHKNEERCVRLRTYKSLLELPTEIAAYACQPATCGQTTRASDGAIVFGKSTKLLKRALPVEPDGGVVARDKKRSNSLFRRALRKIS